MKLNVFFFSLCLTILVGSAYGQASKGSWVLATSSQLTSKRTHYPINDQAVSLPGISYRIDRAIQVDGGNRVEQKAATWSFNIAPEASYFVMDRLAIGAQLSIFRSSTRGDEHRDNHHFRYTEILAGPMVQYYIPISRRQWATIGGSYYYGQLWSAYDEDFAETHRYSTWMQGFTLGGGLVHFLSPKVSVGAQMTYEYQYRLLEASTADDFKSYLTSASLGLRLGLQIWLAGKHSQGNGSE